MFKLNFKKLVTFLSVFVLSLTSIVESTFAETFATKECDPVQVVIHASYGGGTDTTARMMSIRSRRYLKADMQIVGKRGGSGAKAQNYTLTRPKDGWAVQHQMVLELLALACWLSVAALLR